MNNTIRYTALLVLLLFALTAAAQQNHTITCKVMPDNVREAILASNNNVQSLLVYEANADGTHGNILGGFSVGDNQQLTVPAGKQIVLSHAFGGQWNVEKWKANGQELGGSVVEYKGKNKFGYYDDFFYEVTYTMPDADVEVEVWLYYEPSLPNDPGDGTHCLNFVTNCGDNMKFNCQYLSKNTTTVQSDDRYFYVTGGDSIGIVVESKTGWRPRRVEADGAVVYEGDGMYGEMYNDVNGYQFENYYYYLLYVMPDHDVTLYFYGEFRPDNPDHEGNTDLPHIPASNGWDAATGEVTITNLVTYDETNNNYLSSVIDAMKALMEHKHFTAADVKSVVMACDMTPEGWSNASEQICWLFTSSLPTYNLERIDLSRTWDWGSPGKVWIDYQQVPIPFKDGTPSGEGTVAYLFKTYNTGDVSSLQHLILPSCITGFVGNEVFLNLEKLKALTLFSTTPPKVDDDTLDPLPLTMTLYVPAASVELYKEHPYWSRFFDIRPIDDSQITDLTVYLPSDYQDGRYEDMSIVLRNASGEIQRYIVDDRSDYTFRNLPRGSQYSIDLLTTQDVKIATADSVFTFQRYVATGFDQVTPLHNLTLTVKADGRDVTEQCGITWTTAEGSQLGTDKTLKWQPAGTTVGYDVTISSSLASTFFQPPHTTLTVGNVADQVTVNLQHPTLTVVDGQVTDDSGRRIGGAYVTFTLPINDDVCRTYTTVTDGSGNFSLEAVQGAGVLTVSNPRYITWRGNTTLPLADPQATHVVLREITGPVVHYEMPFTESVMEGEVGNVLPVYNDMDNVDVQVYNLTTGQTLENISVQYPQIVLVEGASAGDHLRLTTTSRKNAFKPVETTTVLDSEGKGNATLPLTALGGLSLKMEQTNNVAVTTNIYDANGELYATYAMSNADITVEDMPDGDYTVTMMTSTSLLGRMSRLTHYTEIGLTEGTDYVKQKASVKSGIIKKVTFPTVPVLDETRFYYTDIQNTVFYANKSEVGLGSNFSLRANITLKPEYEGRVTAAQLVVDLPSITAIVPGSAMTGQRVVQFTQQDNRITIPIAIAELGETTRFAVQTLGEGDLQPTAWMLLTIDGQQVRQPLGTAYLHVSGVDISVPEEVAELRVPINGYAPALSLVTVFADDIEIGHAMANTDGFWNVDCMLPENTPVLAHFSVRARFETTSGAIAYTQARELSYDPDAIFAEHVYMFCSSPYVIDGRYIDFDFTSSERKQETLTLRLHMYQTYNWTFHTKLNTTDTTRIESVNLIAKLESGDIVLLPATYDGSLGMWTSHTADIATEMYGGTTPVAVAVDIHLKNMKYKVDSELLSIVNNMLPNMQSSLQETLDLIDSYFDQFTEETDPERLNQLFAEFNEIFGIDPDMEILPEWQNLTDEQFIAKVHELAENFSFDREGFLSANMYDLQMDGITIEHATGLSGAALMEEGYDEIPTTDGKNVYLYSDDVKLIIVDFANDMKVTCDLTAEMPTMANGWNGYTFDDLLKNLSDINNNFDKVKWVIELIQNSCMAMIKGMKIEENIVMCENAIRIYEQAKNEGRMVDEAKRELARVTGNKAFWEGLQNWSNTLKDEGPNVSTALAAFTKGDGPLAKAMTFVSCTVKVVEKALAWAAIICDIAEAVEKLQGVIKIHNEVPNPCEDDAANAERIRKDIVGYGVGTGILYTAVVALDAVALVDTNTGLLAAVGSGGTSLVMSVIGCGLVIVKTLLMETYAKDYKQRINNWEQEIFLLECDREKPDFDPEHPYWKKRIEALKRYNLSVVHDPSGFVYEAVTDNRVQGATASIFYEGDIEDVYGDVHRGPILWDAENYGQVNPQMTNAEGRYNWDVPQGLWQVKIEKNGYETAFSEWLPVPPPQLDVNIGIRQLAQPTVKKAIAYEDGIEVEFSKYMRPETLHGAHIWLTRDGKLLHSNPWPLNTSKNWEGDASYVSRILVHPDEGLKAGDKVTLTVRREVESYAGVQMANDFQQEFVVTNRVRQIATDSILEVPKGGVRQFRVVAYPASAAVGKRVVATFQHDFMATVSETATFDEKGVAMLTIHGLSGGSGCISLAMEEDEKVKTDATVVVLDPNAIPVATPMASRISGTGVLPGDLLELWCDTKGATIWYTTDGSCPCDENGTRRQYTEPIVLNPPVTIRAQAVKGDQPESRVVNFHYDLWTGVRNTNATSPTIEGYYDTDGRRFNHPQRGVNMVRMSDGTTHKVVVK